MKNGQIFKRVCAGEFYSQELCERRWKKQGIRSNKGKEESELWVHNFYKGI